jgi:hypothetical protein
MDLLIVVAKLGGSSGKTPTTQILLPLAKPSSRQQATLQQSGT